MPTVCKSCGRLNRMNAMFCSGCLQQLPAFSPSGPSALEMLGRKRKATLDREQLTRSRGTNARAELRFPYWLPALLLAVSTGFIGWYASVPHTAVSPVQLTPSGNVAMSPSTAHVPEPSASFQQEAMQVPHASYDRSTTSTPSNQTRTDPTTSDGELPAMRTVAAFYRALSSGNGQAAVEAVLPGKRGVGAFHEEHMSRFFGSLREPLVVESIKTVAPNRVQARYAYRASRAWCRTTATIETETVGEQTYIRSIQARC